MADSVNSKLIYLDDVMKNETWKEKSGQKVVRRIFRIQHRKNYSNEISASAQYTTTNLQ